MNCSSPPPDKSSVQKMLKNCIFSGHPNTKLFITDGSQSSLMEAVHCGVPVIGVPAAGDQFVNVDLMVARGLGRRVDFTQYLPWHLEGAVKQILGNNRYLNLLLSSVE